MKSLSYQEAGVDIQAGNKLVEHIKSQASQTYRPEVMSGIGGFAALCELPKRYQDPILVSSTDGVGTKLKLALSLDQHETIGIDLVAMCVNDLVAQGAEPLFFLDYFATARLELPIATRVIQGISKGCQLAGAALVGGETAEMPGLYHNQDYDLAGFSVGIVERSQIIHSGLIQSGDVLIALASSGAHSNGYSLIRKILEIHSISLNTILDGKPLSQHFMEPTLIYVRPILALLEKISIHGIAHITGGGLIENIPRMLAPYTKASINLPSWTWPKLFSWLQEQGCLEFEEMLHTFNCGVGMVLAVSEPQVQETLSILDQNQCQAWVIGGIQSSQEKEPRVEFHS